MALVMSLGPRAHAAEPQQANEKRALELFEQSDALYKQGDFEAAVRKLEEAYGLHQEPILLYNLARAREGLGDFAAAADDYEAYLKKLPTAADRGAIEKRIETLRARVAKEEQMQRDNERAAQQHDGAGPDQPAISDDTDGILAGPLPWIIAGVGVAGVAVGIGLGVTAQSRHDDAVAEAVQTEAVDKQDSAEGLAVGANVAIIAGSVIAATGVVLGIVGLASTPGQERAALELRVGPGALTLRGRF